MSRNYTAMKIRQAKATVPLHAFAHRKGCGFPFTCGLCGLHALNQSVHFHMTQKQLDAICEGLYYPEVPR